MSPEERDLRALQREGFPVTVSPTLPKPERCWYYLHTSGVAPIRCSLPDGHPETPGVKGRGHIYEGA